VDYKIFEPSEKLKPYVKYFWTYVHQLQEHQVPQEYIDLLTYLFKVVFNGRNAHLTDGIGRALGRKARDFSEFVRLTAQTNAWNPEI